MWGKGETKKKEENTLCYKSCVIKPIFFALQWDHFCYESASQLFVAEGRKVTDRTKVKPCNTELEPNSRILNIGERWANIRCLKTTLCPVFSQSGMNPMEVLPLTLLYQLVCFYYFRVTFCSAKWIAELQQNSSCRGLWRCLVQTLLNACPTRLGCSGPCPVKGRCPRTEIPQTLWAPVPVFDHPYRDHISPKIQLAFLIFHVLIATCPSPAHLWEEPGSVYSSAITLPWGSCGQFCLEFSPLRAGGELSSLGCSSYTPCLSLSQPNPVASAGSQCLSCSLTRRLC